MASSEVEKAVGKKAWIEWVLLAIFAIVIGIVLPWMNTLPEENALHFSSFYLNLMGKFLCYAIIALGVDLIWGYTGVLSLGQGVFFALGGYCMGMYLMLAIGEQGHYQSDLPDFMVFLDWERLPWYWPPFRNFWFAITAAVWVPMALALVFGFLAFRSRIKGVYFAIITQALTVAMCLLFFRNNVGLGGNNGLTDFKSILKYDLSEESVKRGLYVMTAVSLMGCFLLCRFIVGSKLGRILTAIRDSEARIRFCGYHPARYKLFVFTLAAGMAGLAGALYVPQVGIINPSEMEAPKSIDMVIWAAVGGRGTLYGAPIGAIAVNGARSFFSTKYPDAMLYFMGGLYILVVMLFPEGVPGIPRRCQGDYRKLKQRMASDPKAGSSTGGEGGSA